MPYQVQTPCPTCGKRFDFPLTGCVTGVAETLLATSGGNCPVCGTRVVIDQPLREVLTRDLLADARTMDEIRAVPVVDLPLSVRCRLALTKLGADTVGDLLDISIGAVCDRLGTTSPCAEQLRELCRQHKFDCQQE
jgi:DNA-directed RNA polymerase subunit RPC12/RpoP